MKLFMIEDVEGKRPTWYFTTKSKAAHYLGVHPNSITAMIKGMFNQCKGYHIEEIEDDNIICKYIDPER